jgi:hypothetical protein
MIPIGLLKVIKVAAPIVIGLFTAADAVAGFGLATKGGTKTGVVDKIITKASEKKK